METFLSARQVQDLLQVDRTTIYRMLKDGRLTAVKVGQQWRFHASKVDDLLAIASRADEREVPISANILPLHCMQPVQDVFAEIAGIGAVTTDKEGRPLTRISNPCDFCKLILGSEDGREACIASWHKIATQSKTDTLFITCHAGLQYTGAPIEVKGELIAALVAGQFYLQQQPPEVEQERLHGLAEKYHIDPELLSRAVRSVQVLDERKTTQISGWLEKVTGTFEEISSERAGLMYRLEQISVMSNLGTGKA
jgi:excisionase family DNA binding protein